MDYCNLQVIFSMPNPSLRLCGCHSDKLGGYRTTKGSEKRQMKGTNVQSETIMNEFSVFPSDGKVPSGDSRFRRACCKKNIAASVIAAKISKSILCCHCQFMFMHPLPQYLYP
jgi:hypothetical protein